MNDEFPAAISDFTEFTLFPPTRLEMAQFGSFLNGTCTPVTNGHHAVEAPLASTSASTSSSNLASPGLLDEYSDYYAELANHLVSSVVYTDLFDSRES